MSKIVKIKKVKKNDTDKRKFEYSVNEPNVVYVTTTQLKNQIGEVIDLVVGEGKEVILKRHGREVMKIEKPKQKKVSKKSKNAADFLSALQAIAEKSKGKNTPTDLAMNLDKYLYGDERI